MEGKVVIESGEIGDPQSAPELSLASAVAETHGGATAQSVATREAVFALDNVSVTYNGRPAVADVSMEMYRNAITALIGPSGCGKSTLIRCLNRMNDLIPSASVEGKVLYHGEDIYAPRIDA